jgi:predicted nucleotide-binding protein (sugar kinase/HSP70/actin superfamily)
VPVEMMTFEEHNIKPGEILWCTFNKMNSRLKNLDMNKYAGVIQITTFNCGTDSMMTERFRRESRHSKIPYMLLMIDEHTGKAGIDTRLEAFVDSLSWNKNL